MILLIESLEFSEIKQLKEKPDKRNSHSIIYDKVQERLVIFGGADSEGPLDTIWAYWIEKNSWEEIINKFDGLKAREMHTCHIYYSENDGLVGEDDKKTKIVNSETKTTQKIVEICFDVQAEKEVNEEKITENQEKSKEIPKKNIIFEGEEIKADDIEEVAKEKTLPTQVLQNKNKNLTAYMFIIGGRTLDGISNEIFLINLNKWTCKLVAKLPHGICTHASTILKDQIFIYGGTDGFNFLNYLYCYDIKTNKLKRTLIDDSIKGFEARIAAGMTSDDEGKLIIFGGSTFEEEKNELLLIKVADLNMNDI